MTKDEISGAYDELAKMFVELVNEPERGLPYIRERLVLCRVMQDRLGELRLTVNREQSVVMERLLTKQFLHELQATDAKGKQELEELERSKQALGYLTRAIKDQQQHLSRTAMDIRLLHEITKDQIKRGEIDPREVTGLIKETPVSELSPIQPLPFGQPGPSGFMPDERTVVAGTPDAPSGWDSYPGMVSPEFSTKDTSQLQPPLTVTGNGTGRTLAEFNPFAAQTVYPAAGAESAAEIVSLNSPDGPAEPEPLAPLADTESVSFEQILTTDKRGPHGSTPAPRIF